jgi:hypothetical protein
VKQAQTRESTRVLHGIHLPGADGRGNGPFEQLFKEALTLSSKKCALPYNQSPRALCIVDAVVAFLQKNHYDPTNHWIDDPNRLTPFKH